MYTHFDSILAFLKFVKSVSCSYFVPTFYKKSFLRVMQFEILDLLEIHVYLSHIKHFYLQWVHTLALRRSYIGIITVYEL